MASRAQVARAAALVGGVLGRALVVSTATGPCAGPCSDTVRIYLPRRWLDRWRPSGDVLLAILAHEAAHQRHPTDGRAEELRADWWAGYVLGRLGRTPEAFVALLHQLGEGREHPAPWIRGATCKAGYAHGRAAFLAGATAPG